MLCGLPIDGKVLQVPHLVCLEPDPTQSELFCIPLKDGVNRLGTEGDIALVGEGIEPHHADIQCTSGELFIVPSHGVAYLNGKKVTSVTPMGQGSRLIIGKLFFRLSNPNKKEWVNPPGYQYAQEELQREQDIIQKRGRRSRSERPEGEERRKAGKSSERKKLASSPPRVIEVAPAPDVPEDIIASPVDASPVDASPRSLPESPDRSAFPSPTNARTSRLVLTKHLATTVGFRQNSMDSSHFAAGPFTIPPYHRSEEAYRPAMDEISRLRRALVEMEVGHRRQMEEQMRKLQEEKRRSAELEKAVAQLEKRLKDKVMEDNVAKAEDLVLQIEEVVKEAQHLTFLLGKPVHFSVRLQTSWDESTLSFNATGAGVSMEAMQSEAAVLVKDTRDPTSGVVVDSRRFIALLQEMRQVHQQLAEAVDKDRSCIVPWEDDPWEKVFDMPTYVGCARILMQDLLHNIPIEGLPSTIMDNAGKKIGEVRVDIQPCSPDGLPVGDDPELFIDDDEFEDRWLGQRWDATLSIRHLELNLGHKYSHVYLGYTFWSDSEEYRSEKLPLEPGQKAVDPGFVQQHTNEGVDLMFIEYLKSRAIQLKVYAYVQKSGFVPLSSEDDHIRRLVLRGAKSMLARRPYTAPLEVSVEVSRLEAKCRQQELTIMELTLQAQTAQSQLSNLTEERSRMERLLQDRDATVAELRQKKKELNQLLKSEKEKFLARQTQLKQRIATLEKASPHSPPLEGSLQRAELADQLNDGRLVTRVSLRSLRGLEERSEEDRSLMLVASS